MIRTISVASLRKPLKKRKVFLNHKVKATLDTEDKHFPLRSLPTIENLWASLRSSRENSSNSTLTEQGNNNERVPTVETLIKTSSLERRLWRSRGFMNIPWAASVFNSCEAISSAKEHYSDLFLDDDSNRLSSQLIPVGDFYRTEEVSENNSSSSSGNSNRPFKCTLCDKAYRSMCSLKIHTQTHTLPFKCNLCDKGFSRPWLLAGHVRTHTGEKPFSCPQCERAFADRSNLRAHLQTHAKVKKYLCTHCSKSFCRMSLLLKHRINCEIYSSSA